MRLRKSHTLELSRMEVSHCYPCHTRCENALCHRNLVHGDEVLTAKDASRPPRNQLGVCEGQPPFACCMLVYLVAHLPHAAHVKAELTESGNFSYASSHTFLMLRCATVSRFSTMATSEADRRRARSSLTMYASPRRRLPSHPRPPANSLVLMWGKCLGTLVLASNSSPCYRLQTLSRFVDGDRFLRKASEGIKISRRLAFEDINLAISQRNCRTCT